MKKYFNAIKNLAFTRTAKDTYLIFSGNLLSAFLGFVYTLIAARVLSVNDFGVFSAVTNLVYLIISLTDLGVSSGVIQFVAKLRAEGKDDEADKYIKSAFLIKMGMTLLVGLVICINPLFFAQKFMATDDKTVSYWVFISSLAFVFYTFFPYILQAKNKFLKSVVVENSYGLLRLLFTLLFFFLGIANLSTLLLSFTLGNLGPLILGFIYIGIGYIFAKPDLKVYKNLLLFSGWLGLSRVISSVSGRLDVQMLASMSGALETGIYSIASRLSIFILILTGSFSTVLAPRLSSFNDKKKERAYIIKASFALIPIIAGILFWIAIAEPFIVLLFGEKYITSVPVFRVLAFSAIPFLTTAPAAAAIVYSMKKTFYIGIFAVPQLVMTLLLNYFLIPAYGVFGPAYSLIVINFVIAFYVWFIVIRYYWFDKKSF